MPTPLNRRISLVLAIALVVPLAAGCAKASPLDDPTITTRVKTAILNDPRVGKSRIDVDTVNGVVTLSGRVDTVAERDRAVALARLVNGVVDVKDALEIPPKP